MPSLMHTQDWVFGALGLVLPLGVVWLYHGWSTSSWMPRLLREFLTLGVLKTDDELSRDEWISGDGDATVINGPRDMITERLIAKALRQLADVPQERRFEIAMQLSDVVERAVRSTPTASASQE